jgi:capsular exopolysaccharide synthesis family protein
MPRRRSLTIDRDRQRSEAFRVLRSNLLVALSDLERPTVLVTSALAGEGKTTVCANIAVSLAEAGLRVVAVDADLRHPNLHQVLGAHNEVGLSDVLLERARLDSALQFVSVGGRQGRGLYVLPTGSPVNDATELIGSARTSRLLAGLTRQADLVLLDTPPILPVADTLVIGRMVAGALIVVEARRTATTSVQQAKNALTRNQTRLLGVVLNKLPQSELAVGYGYGSPVDEDVDALT